MSGPTNNFGTQAMLKLIQPNPQGLGCHIQKRNRFNTLTKLSISMGLKVLSWIPTKVANLMDVCFKRCMLKEVGFAS